MPATVDEQGHGGSKQERKMHMRNGLWSIVVGGTVRVMLAVGVAKAAAPKDALAQCQASLNTCTTSLGTCTTNLGTCQTDLAVCLAEPTVIFPGDGYNSPDAIGVSGHGPVLSYTDNGDGTFTDNNTLLMWE